MTSRTLFSRDFVKKTMLGKGPIRRPKLCWHYLHCNAYLLIITEFKTGSAYPGNFNRVPDEMLECTTRETVGETWWIRACSSKAHSGDITRQRTDEYQWRRGLEMAIAHGLGFVKGCLTG